MSDIPVEQWNDLVRLSNDTERRLRSELAAAQKEIEMLHADVAEAESDAKDYASELTADQERSAQLSIENAELLQREEELVAERTALRAEVERLTKERDEAHKERDIVIGKLTVERNYGQEQKARAQSAEAELAELREAAMKLIRMWLKGSWQAGAWGEAIHTLRALIEKEGE